MRKIPKNVLDLPLEKRALLALRAAVKKAIAEHLRDGLPVYVWQDGKVVDLSARKSSTRSRPPAKRRSRHGR